LGEKQGRLLPCCCRCAAANLPSCCCVAYTAAEKERDGALLAILDRVVGLGWDKGWTPKLSQR
jgi:hypothetical protein